MIAAIGDAAGLVAAAGVFGAMAFFAFVYVPHVFHPPSRRLDRRLSAGRHAREAAPPPAWQPNPLEGVVDKSYFRGIIRL